MPDLNQNEIARLSGVSQATVSRVLNGDARVKPELRERVLAVVREHDYVPDARARSLRSQQTGTIGLVVHRQPDQLAEDPFFSALIGAIIEFGGKQDYHLCVDAARARNSRREIYEDLLRTRRVDGLILVEPQADDERIIRLIEAGFPFVLIGRCEPGAPVPSVDNDNVGAGRLATGHLLSRGHRRIGFIGGPPGVFVSEDRLEGYRQSLAGAGIAFQKEWVCHGDFSVTGGFQALSQWHENGSLPTGIVAVDDVTAIGAMRAAKERGLKIPEQIAFVGFNDSPFCAYVDPPLTSVAIEIKSLAEHATAMLIQRIQEEAHPAPERMILPCQLIIRATS